MKKSPKTRTTSDICVYFFIVLFAIKRTFLFALLASNRRTILSFWIGATLTFITDKRCDYVTIFAMSRFTILFRVAFAFWTYCIHVVLPISKLISKEWKYWVFGIIEVPSDWWELTATVGIQYDSTYISRLDRRHDKSVKMIEMMIIEESTIRWREEGWKLQWITHFTHH